jgi:hypothetical protein
VDLDKHSKDEPDVESAENESSELTVEPGRPFQAKGSDRSKSEGESDETALPPVPVVLVPAFVGEEQVRGFLIAQGALAHGLVAVEHESDEWVYLEADLEALAPPLTRIINRFPIAASVFERLGDYPALAMGAAGYVGRSLEERAAGKARLAAGEESEPTTDVPFRFGGSEE